MQRVDPGSPSLGSDFRKANELCRPLIFFASSLGVGAYIAIPDRVSVFWCAKEDWTVMTEFALVAPDKLEKKQYTHSIQPSQRLPAGAVDFPITAVRALVPSDLEHERNVFLLSDVFVFRQLSGALPVLILARSWRLLVPLFLLPLSQ